MILSNIYFCRCSRASLHNQFSFNSPVSSAFKPAAPLPFFFLLNMCMPVRNHGELGVFFSLITHLDVCVCVCDVHLNCTGRRKKKNRKGEVGKNTVWPFPCILAKESTWCFFVSILCESKEYLAISMQKGSCFA